MLPRRKTVLRLFCRLFAGVLVVAPYQIAADGLSLHIVGASAFAQGNSGGNGAGDPGGNGSGGGNGNGNGNSGNAGGNGPGNGNAGGNSQGGGRQSGAGQGRQPAMAVQHGDGMIEKVSNGRYEMRDAQGRVISNRPAKPSDYVRLRALSR